MAGVLVLAVGAFALGLNAYVVAGLLPDIGADLHVSAGTAGQVVTTFTLAYALLAPPIATWVARMRMRTIMVGALGVFGAANLVATATHALPGLLAARAVAGVAAGVYTPLATTAATRLLPEYHRGRALALVSGGLSAGAVLGVPIGVLLARSSGWRPALWVVAGLAAVTLVGIRVVLPALPGTAPPPLSQRIAALGDRRVASVVVVSFLVAWATLGAYTYVGTLLPELAGVGQLAPYLFCWGLGGAAAIVLAGVLVDRGLSAPRVVLGIVAALVLALATLPAAGANPVSTVIVLLLWGGAGWSLQVPQQQRLLAARPEQGAVLVALNGSALYLGSAVGAAVGGLALSVTGPAAFAYISAGIAAVALLVHVTASRPVELTEETR